MEEHNGKVKEFNGLNREIEGLYHVVSRKVGLSDGAFTVLYNIWDMGEGCLQRDICSAACVSKQTVHSVVKKLEQEGVVYLKPGKGRELGIFLTEGGRALVEEKIVPVAAMEGEAFGHLTEEEWREHLRVMRKYLEYFRTKVKEL